MVILPRGFRLPPKQRLSPLLKFVTEGLFLQPYSFIQNNLVVLGPVSVFVPFHFRIEHYLIFPIVAPLYIISLIFKNYKVAAAADIGAGQIFPTGSANNNLLSDRKGLVNRCGNLCVVGRSKYKFLVDSRGRFPAKISLVFRKFFARF